MRIRIICRNGQCRGRVQLFDSSAACPRCGTRHALEPIQPDQVIEQCLCCGSDELYVRKDFPQRLGLATVVVVAVASIYLFAVGELLWSLWILMATVLVDLVIYCLVPRMTVCYRCKAEYRLCRTNPQHRGFDLATAEKYRSANFNTEAPAAASRLRHGEEQ